jgi:hypothetical protein
MSGGTKEAFILLERPFHARVKIAREATRERIICFDTSRSLPHAGLLDSSPLILYLILVWNGVPVTVAKSWPLDREGPIGSRHSTLRD